MLLLIATQMTVLTVTVRAGYKQSSELYKKLLTDQDHRVRPALNSSAPTDVYVVMHLISLREIVETQQHYMINAWMEFAWKDEIRTWDPAEYGDVRVIYPDPGDSWLPRVMISNSVNKRDLFTVDHTIHSIFWDGGSHWFPGTVISAACILDLTVFPFDSQTCTLHFISQTFDWDVNFIPAQDIDTSSYSPNCEWSLEFTKVRIQPIAYQNMTLASLYFDFTFGRRLIFYIINVYAPVTLISLLAPLVFVLPEESGERASYSVTLLLSLTVFLSMVSGKLPQCSEPLPIAVVYILAMLIHSGLCVVCTIVQLRLVQNKAGQTKDQHDDVKTGSDRKNQNNLAASWLGKVQNEDASGNPGLTQEGYIAMKDNAIEFGDKSIHVNNLTTSAFTATPCGDADGGNGSRTAYGTERLTRLSLCGLGNSNIALLAFFYISWLAITLYFIIKLSTPKNETSKPLSV